MSLVTRCPACGTTFKVVRDQLRISEGWVRCGRCSEVFDATVELQETAEAAPPSTAERRSEAPLHPFATNAPAGPASGAEAVTQAEEPARPKEAAEADFLDVEPQIDSPVAEEPVAPAAASPAPTPEAKATPDPLSLAGILTDEPWPEASAFVDVQPYVPRYPSLPPFPQIDLSLPASPPVRRMEMPATGLNPGQADTTSPNAQEDAANVQLQKALRRARAKSAKIARAKARGEERAARESAPVVLTAAEPEAVLESPRRLPRFATTEERPSFWAHAAGRRTLVIVAVLASLLLLLQMLRQERDLIVARQPALRPVVAAVCGLTGCEISALRQIRDITIDGASFAREKSGDAYRLSFALRNSAEVPLAMPAVELSLLDTQERTVVRRVLTPVEFGAPAALPPRGQRAASLALALSGPEVAALPPVAGFHLLAFYP